MAKYDATKFYWLQLKEDFFDEDAIDWLEEQPNGKEYSLFYLKLCLKSLRTNGVLIRQVGNMLVPYDHVKLGELTKTNADTVMVAMNLLLQIGLVQKLENGELYLTQVEHMIGSQSKSAFKKQQQRLTRKNTLLLNGGQEGDNCPPKIEKEIEIDLEEEKEDKLDKLDKPQGGNEEFINNDYEIPLHSLTAELIKRNFIESNDLDIYRYNELFTELLENYDYVLVCKVINYVIARMTYKTDIDDKFNYFKYSVLDNLEQQTKTNSIPEDHWLNG